MLKDTGAGKRLYNLRIENKKTLEQVVVEINEQYGLSLSRGNLSRWERGENEPSLSTARRLCEYYNISLDYLVGLTDEKEGKYDNS